VPRIDRDDDVLRTIPGEPPDMSRLPPGCPFSPRCEHVREICASDDPPLVTLPGPRRRACHVPMVEMAAA